MKKCFLLCIQFICVYFLYAQNQIGQPGYPQHEIFVPHFNPPAGNGFRSAKGIPGPLYWQNEANYKIQSTLSEKDTSISGNVTISYINNSPGKLDYLWLQLDQNIF